MFLYKHSNQLAFSPPFAFVFKGYADMLARNLTHPALDFGNQHEVVWAVDDGAVNQIVGAQVFHVDRTGRGFTAFAYVEDVYRGQGIAVGLFTQLELVLKRRLGDGLKVIYTSAVDENEKIQRVFAKTGRDQYTAKFAKFYNVG